MSLSNDKKQCEISLHFFDSSIYTNLDKKKEENLPSNKVHFKVKFWLKYFTVIKEKSASIRINYIFFKTSRNVRKSFAVH